LTPIAVAEHDGKRKTTQAVAAIDLGQGALLNIRSDRALSMEANMAIGNAVRVQALQVINVYNEHGQQIGAISTGQDGVLAGYTSTTVNVRSDNRRIITSYNEQGQQTAVVSF
jgi:hypothetical protein